MTLNPISLDPISLDRRAFLNACRCAGIASPLLPGILLTLAAQADAQVMSPDAGADATVKPPTLPKITDAMLDRAAELAGVGPFSAEQKKIMLDGLNDQRDAYAQIRALKLNNDVPPAYVFHPGKAATSEEAAATNKSTKPDVPDLSQTISGGGIYSIPSAPTRI